jgi:hypothetical protein
MKMLRLLRKECRLALFCSKMEDDVMTSKQRIKLTHASEAALSTVLKTTMLYHGNIRCSVNCQTYTPQTTKMKSYTTH